MTFKIPYKAFPMPTGEVDYRAALSVQLARVEKNSPRTRRFEAFIDSGASRCIFHASIGEAIGLQLASGVAENTMGISGKPSSVYLHDVCLYVPGGSIPIRAAFSTDLPVAGLLGMSGFFEHFRIVFDPVARQCELERIHRG